MLVLPFFLKRKVNELRISLLEHTAHSRGENVNHEAFFP